MLIHIVTSQLTKYGGLRDQQSVVLETNLWTEFIYNALMS